MDQTLMLEYENTFSLSSHLETQVSRFNRHLAMTTMLSIAFWYEIEVSLLIFFSRLIEVFLRLFFQSIAFSPQHRCSLSSRAAVQIAQLP